jgi:transmembrane protein
VFTLATIPVAHQFWTMEGMVAFLDKALVQEHFSVIGGLILVAILAELKFREDD